MQTATDLPRSAAKGDSYDKALAGTISGLCKAELTRKRSINPTFN